MPEFIPKQYKSIINKKKIIDSWFWDKYTINPYNGCLFGCIYCDARSSKYYMPEDFENQIVIKQNVGELLDSRISRARTFLPDVVAIAGVTDPYQPAEKTCFNTRKCLEVLAKQKYPVHIITKSAMVERDFELLEEIAQQTWCCVSITIPTIDPAVARFLDNRSPAPAERLQIISQIKQKASSVMSGVLLIPLVPFLCDSEPDLIGLVQAVKEAKADYLLFGGSMTLRDQQALWFLRHLSKQYPELVPRYEKLYEFSYNAKNYGGRHSPPLRYMVPKHKLLFDLCEKYRLAFRIPRFLPNDFRRSNYTIAEILFNEAHLRQMLDEDWTTQFWAAHNIQNLSEPIELLVKRDELGKIRNVNWNLQVRIRRFLTGEKF